MNFINKRQFQVCWAACAVAGLVFGLFPPDLSATDSGFNRSSTNILSSGTNNFDHVKERAQTLQDLITGDKTQTERDYGARENSEDVDSAVPFSAIRNSSQNGPFISAIVSEAGVRSAFLRDDQGNMSVLSAGETWNGWKIEKIDASRVYFSNDDENFDYFVFATLGQ